MALRVCARSGCPILSGNRYCATHGGNHTGWSPQRDRSAQARFRRQVLERDNFTCQDCGLHDPTGKTLRACHIAPLSEGGTYDLSNGITRCQQHDRATDPHAR